MNTSKTVPAATPTPTRRQALTGLFGLAAAATAGLAVAAPKSAPAATAPARTSAAAPRDLEDRRVVGPVPDDEVDDSMYHVLTPSQERRRARAMFPVLLGLGEAEDALDAAIDAHDEAHDGDDNDVDEDVRDKEWRAALVGLSYMFCWFHSVISGFAACGEKSSDRVRTRRRKAFDAGRLHCGCPVLWAERALDAAVDALEQHGDELLGIPAWDAKRQLWALREMRSGFDNQSHCRMNVEASAEYKRELWNRLPELTKVDASTD